MYSMYFTAVRTTSVPFFNIGKHGWWLLLVLYLHPLLIPRKSTEFCIYTMIDDVLKALKVLVFSNINDHGRYYLGWLVLGMK